MIEVILLFAILFIAQLFIDDFEINNEITKLEKWVDGEK